MIYCATGHRPDKLSGGYSKDTYLALRKFAIEIISEYKPSEMIVGMAQGWDTACALACCDLTIPFIAAVPFLGQERKWPELAQRSYRRLLEKAKQVMVVSNGAYAAHKMQVRNQWMCDHSEAVLALWDGSGGGTANCVNYAKSKNLPVHNVYDRWTTKGLSMDELMINRDSRPAINGGPDDGE